MNHVVHKLFLDLSFPSDEKSLSALTYKIDNEYRDKIVSVINEVLEKVPLHINVFIEKIELDIHGSDLETVIREVREQLVSKIQQAIEIERLKIPDNITTEVDPLSPSESTIKTGNFTPQDAEKLWTFESLRYFLEKGLFIWEGQKLVLRQNPDLVHEIIQFYISQKRTELIDLFTKKPASFIRFLLYFKDSQGVLNQKIADHFDYFKPDIITLLLHLAQVKPAHLAGLESNEAARFFNLLSINSPTQEHSIKAVLILIELIAKIDLPSVNLSGQSAIRFDAKFFKKIAGKGILISTDFQTIARETAKNKADISVHRRANEEELSTNILVKNAGMVILNPFLAPFFEELKLLSNTNFADKFRQIKAIQLLHYLATYQLTFEEDEIVFYKILCGLNPDEPVFPAGKLTRKEKKAGQELLRDVIRHWEILKNTSPEVLQHDFLQRSGLLSLENRHYRLIVDKKSIDILLQRLPWSIGIIKLPWIEKLVIVQWDD